MESINTIRFSPLCGSGITAAGELINRAIEVMLTETVQNNDYAAKTHQMIHQLVDERQQMLVLFCQVAGLEPYTCRKPLQDLLKEFCQVMVDYIALGHFEVYQRIGESEGSNTEYEALIKRLVPQIEAVTERAVAFNDKYCQDHYCSHLGQLASDLSLLGEDLAARIELEDRLIGELIEIPNY